MSKYENNLKRDILPSLWHRALGRACFASDIDSFEMTSMNTEDSFMEFKIDLNNYECVAFFDYKMILSNPEKPQRFSDDYAPIRAQGKIADLQFKTPVPFFLALTFLDESYPDKMYYIIPINTSAKKFFKKYNISIKGNWQTTLQFSQFQHLLRKIKWNPEEIINERICDTINLPQGSKLKNLPNTKIKYNLPQLSFNYFSD